MITKSRWNRHGLVFTYSGDEWICDGIVIKFSYDFTRVGYPRSDPTYVLKRINEGRNESSYINQHHSLSDDDVMSVGHSLRPKFSRVVTKLFYWFHALADPSLPNDRPSFRSHEPRKQVPKTPWNEKRNGLKFKIRPTHKSEKGNTVGTKFPRKRGRNGSNPFRHVHDNEQYDDPRIASSHNLWILHW